MAFLASLQAFWNMSGAYPCGASYDATLLFLCIANSGGLVRGRLIARIDFLSDKLIKLG
jgi:hypothetical protein